MQYNFEGRFDLIKFIKMIQEHDMYAIVRIGPFIQAEWNHGFVRPTNCLLDISYARFIRLFHVSSIFSTLFPVVCLIG